MCALTDLRGLLFGRYAAVVVYFVENYVFCDDYFAYRRDLYSEDISRYIAYEVAYIGPWLKSLFPP